MVDLRVVLVFVFVGVYFEDLLVLVVVDDCYRVEVEWLVDGVDCFDLVLWFVWCLFCWVFELLVLVEFWFVYIN